MPTATFKCTYCKKRFPQEQKISINKGNFCSDNHIVNYAKKHIEKGRRKLLAHQKKEHKKRLKEVKPLKHWIDLTQKSFNKMRVLQELLWFKDRGLEPECISCAKKNMDWCCGHFKTRGASSNLAFDEKNTYLQCNRYCNCGLSGNVEGNKTTRGYKQGLRDRFGEEAEQIIDYCETSNNTVKWTREELEAMRKHYNSEIRRLIKLV